MDFFLHDEGGATVKRQVLAIFAVLTLASLALLSKAPKVQKHATQQVQDASVPRSVTAISTQSGIVLCSPTPVTLSIEGGTTPGDKTDLDQAEHFCRAIKDLFEQEQFERLDQIADRARAEKSRFAGGAWKLYAFYGVVASMTSPPTESNWEAQIAKLNRWLIARPKSVAGRIALAALYEKYSYAVTANGSGPEVEAAMRTAMNDRLKRSRDLLDQARALNPKDPQIDLVLLRVARSLAWGTPAIDKLFAQAIAAEPGYYYYYLQQVDTLREDGAEGGPVRFAETSADSIGGVDGDIIYFHIAHEFGFYNPQYLEKMSWLRIARGYEATEATYGTSWIKLNWLCQLAIYRDEMQQASGFFDRIGSHWDEETWQYLEIFESYRGIAQTVQALDGPETSKSPQITKYNNAVGDLFRQKYSNTLKQCTVRAENPVPPSFNVYLQIEADGTEMGSAFLSSHEVPHCLDTALQSARFPAPPHDLLGDDKTAVWVRIPIRLDHLSNTD